jgi:hypothetical protein
MPSEAQLKAQMQAAIAKKKQAEKKPSPDKSVAPISPPPPPEKPPVVETANAPKAEPKDTITPLPSPPKSEPTSSPMTLTFYGQPIRLTTYRNDVFFAVPDLLALANNADSANIYLEFRNQPSTRTKAETLVKTLPFSNADGEEKIDAAKSADAIRLLQELKLSAPGPLSRWLDEITDQYRHQDEPDSSAV